MTTIFVLIMTLPVTTQLLELKKVDKISEVDRERATSLLAEAYSTEYGRNYRKTRLALMEVERLGGARIVFNLSFKQMCYRFFPGHNDLTLNRELTVGQIEDSLGLTVGTTTEYNMKALKQFTKVGVRSNAVRGLSPEGTKLIKECWELAKQIGEQFIPNRLDLKIAAQEICQRHNIQREPVSSAKKQADKQDYLELLRSAEENNRQLQAVIRQLRNSAGTEDLVDVNLLRQTLEDSIEQRTKLHDTNSRLKRELEAVKRKAETFETKYYNSLRKFTSVENKVA